MIRHLTTRQLAADIVVGALWLLFGAVTFLRGSGEADPLWLVIFALSVALVLRRLMPGVALGVAWMGAVLQVLIQAPPNAYDLAIFAVLYATASYGGRIVRWLGLVSAPVGAAVIAWSQLLQQTTSTRPDPEFLGIVLPPAIWATITTFIGYLVAFLLAWTLGSLARVWRTSRDARLAEAAAQREIVVQQERNRIARDLHDVVAHSLAVVIAQADGARYSSDPVAKDGSLATISATAREALGDVRLLLARLRHQEGVGPQPVLADLDALVEQVRASGLDVSLERSGSPLALPPGQQLAVYRIVQEALTNALRHGDHGEPVIVSLAWTAAGVALQIRNVASGPQQPAGHGLPGMRERAGLAGGELTAGPDGRDWVVSASIPLGGAA
jgi:signal transduction histidine kinase